jgi:hypothetical protein
MAKSKKNGQAEPTAPVTDTIKYEVACDELKEIHARFEVDHRRKGEIAHKVETKYGDQTLAKLSKETGFADCTLERHRSVYRAWMANPAPGPVSYSVMRALQDHPDRHKIVMENPVMTKSEAQGIMTKWRAENGGPTTPPEDHADDDGLLGDDGEGPPPPAPASSTKATTTRGPRRRRTRFRTTNGPGI